MACNAKLNPQRRRHLATEILPPLAASRRTSWSVTKKGIAAHRATELLLVTARDMAASPPSAVVYV